MIGGAVHKQKYEINDVHSFDYLFNIVSNEIK